jgi:hypothetical protein
MLCPCSPRPRTALVLLAGLLALALATPATAQQSSETDSNANTTDVEPQPSVSPDRPGFTNGTGVVAPGRFQLEAGASAEFSQLTNSYTPLNLLGRIGLSDLAELRLGVTPVGISKLTAPAISTEVDNTTQTSYLPGLTLGAKFAGPVSDTIEIGMLPSASVLGVTDNATLTAGVDALLGIGGMGPFSLTINAGASNLVAVGGGVGTTDLLTITAATTAGLSVSDTVGVFLEPYLEAPLSGSATASLQGGVTWLTMRQLQLDAWGDVELNQGNAVSVGLGASYLF